MYNNIKGFFIAFSILNMSNQPIKQLANQVNHEAPMAAWRVQLYQVIFESDTKTGQLFDRFLIAFILLSVATVVADSVQTIHQRVGHIFQVLEWCFTIIFTLEYFARLVCVRQPLRYALSFFGIVDLLSLLPTYIALFVPEAHALIDVRALRLLRIFRIFRLTAFVSEYLSLGRALKASARKIMIFLSVVLMVVLILGTLLYVIEGPEHGFTSIPTAVYWAITTITTVGYGDIAPKTDLGRFIASVIMLLGWGTLAVPTGIVSTEMAFEKLRPLPAPVTQTCQNCLTEGHDLDAQYCKYCAYEIGVSPAHQAPQKAS